MASYTRSTSLDAWFEESMKIVIADDLPLFRDALARVITRVYPNSQLIHVASYSALENVLQKHSDVDFVFMDLHVPGNTGLSGVAALRSERPAIKLAVVSATESPMIVYRTVKLGAKGFIPKTADAETFRRAVSSILTDKTWIPEELKTRMSPLADKSELENQGCDKSECLSEKIASLSPRQFKVLSMISDGQLNKQIAYVLELQEGTVKHHVSLILQKLNVINRTGAANMFNRLKVEKRLNMPLVD